MASSEGGGRWLPLESNPEVLNKFCLRMGMSEEWGWRDVWGLDPELLAFIPQPVAAVSLLFPSVKEIHNFKTEQATKIESEGQKVAESLSFMKQIVLLALLGLTDAALSTRGCIT